MLGIAGIARAIPTIPDIGTRNSDRNSKYAAGIAHNIAAGSSAQDPGSWRAVRAPRIVRATDVPMVAWPARPCGTHDACPYAAVAWTGAQGDSGRGTAERGTTERGAAATSEVPTSEEPTSEVPASERGAPERGADERGADELDTGEHGRR